MSIGDTVRKVVGRINDAVNKVPYDFHVKSREQRERQVEDDYTRAQAAKTIQVERMKRLDEYYRNEHYAEKQAKEISSKLGLQWKPPVMPDPFIQVESQIDDIVPEVEFKGRDDDTDNVKARQREDLVRYVMQTNNVDELNVQNERTLLTLGDAFWKVAWDGSIECRSPGGKVVEGDIAIGNPDPASIFPDPSAYNVDDCEFIIYAYRLHRRKARRVFGKVIDNIMPDGDKARTEIYDTGNGDLDEQSVEVVEYWYKDDEGDVACSIQVAGEEVRHIPKYWERTRHSGNKMFPLIKYSRIPRRKSFWSFSDLDHIIPLADARDRELVSSLMNDMLMGNDVVIAERGALADGQEWSNQPGAFIETNSGKGGMIRRLGGLVNNTNSFNMMEKLHEVIQETCGNFVSSQGSEPVRVTTASGIAQLNERADRRQNVKKAGRVDGYRRLAELIDWTILEFYDEDRQLLIRGKTAEEKDRMVVFNSTKLAMQTGDPLSSQPYWPRVDIEIRVGDGIKRSKAFTLAATQELAQMNITPANAPIVKSIVDILELPNAQEIKEGIDAVMGMQMQQQAMAMAPGPTQGVPASPPQAPQPQGLDPNAVVAAMSPEQQAAFMQLSPEEQQAMLDAAMGGEQGD
jgi:hypothetical protein